MADVAIDVFGCDRSNRSGLGGFVAVGPEGSGVKRSTRPEAVVEGMAIDRHRQRMEHTRQGPDLSSQRGTYHVLVPKRRRKALFGSIRQKLGRIFHERARQKECQIVEGQVMPDHVHTCASRFRRSSRWRRLSGS